jgi:hypothetical protein
VPRIARRLSTVGGLVVLIATAALLVAGAGVAGASAQTTPVPCGTAAEFASPHGSQSPVQETGSILSAFTLPGAQIPNFLAEFEPLGTSVSSPSIPAPPCGLEGVVAE